MIYWPRELSPYSRAGYGSSIVVHCSPFPIPDSPSSFTALLWPKPRWNDAVCASIRRTIDPDPAKNCVNNTSKALQNLKCFKSSEMQPNMPITPLEMVSLTFRFKVKRHRNAAERNERRSEDTFVLMGPHWANILEFSRRSEVFERDRPRFKGSACLFHGLGAFRARLG
jgi:hypothetical protein